MPLALIALHWAVAALLWPGLGWMDSLEYSRAAMDLLDGTLPRDHWGLRWPLTLPLTLGAGLLGPSELTLSLPLLLVSSVLVWLAWLCGCRWSNAATGRAAGALFATSPVFASMGIIVAVPETLFTLAAIALAARAERARDFVLAGVLAWAAWACRETSAYLPVTLALVTLVAAKPAMVRRGVAAAAILAAFATALLAELAFYRAVYGAWLFRMRADLAHGQDAPGTRILDTAPGRAETWAAPILETIAASLLTPIWLVALPGLALLVIGIARHGMAPGNTEGRRAALHLVAGSVAAYLLAVGVLNLERYYYYPVVAVAAVFLAARAIAALAARRPRAGAALLVSVCTASVALSLVTRPPDAGTAERLAAAAEEHGSPIKADTKIKRSRLLLRMQGLSPTLLTRLREGDPIMAGDLVFAAEGALSPGPGWQILARYEGRPQPLPARLIDRVDPGLAVRVLGDRAQARPDWLLWRVGPG